MGLLVTGLLLFFGIHAVPMLAGGRAALVARHYHGALFGVPVTY